MNHRSLVFRAIAGAAATTLGALLVSGPASAASPPLESAFSTPLAGPPVSVFTNVSGGPIWVVTSGIPTLVALDPATGAVLSSFWLPESGDVVVVKSTHTAYVTQHDDESVLPIDTLTGEAGDPITLLARPNELAVDLKQNMLYALSTEDRTVVGVDLRSNRARIAGHFAATDKPSGMAIDPDTSDIFVDRGSSPASIAVLRPGRLSIRDTYSTTETASALAFDAPRGRVLGAGASGVSALDLSTGRSSLVLPAGPAHAISVDPRTDRAYVGTAAGAVIAADLRYDAQLASTILGSPATDLDFSRSSGVVVAGTRGVAGTVGIADHLPYLGDTIVPNGQVGRPYSFHIPVSAAPAPSVVLTAGALPPGLTLDAATGLISGTPTGWGTYVFTVTASNGSAVINHDYQVVVKP